jgi:uncharacterized protein (DUF2132 family)
MTADEPDATPRVPETVDGAKPSAAPPTQPRNPLHGVTLEAIVTALVDQYGWAGLGERIPVRCFNVDPSVTSSLRFLRKTPWARDKVEQLYLAMERHRQRTTPRRG